MAPRIDPKLKSAYEFFKKHGGSVVGRSAEVALALARAEKTAEALGWSVDWVHDEEAYDSGDSDHEPSEVLGAVLKDQDGEQLESLWSIADPDRNYARVVEAELALEALMRKKLL